MSLRRCVISFSARPLSSFRNNIISFYHNHQSNYQLFVWIRHFGIRFCRLHKGMEVDDRKMESIDNSVGNYQKSEGITWTENHCQQGNEWNKATEKFKKQVQKLSARKPGLSYFYIINIIFQLLYNSLTCLICFYFMFIHIVPGTQVTLHIGHGFS